jgi:hypothetical protein
VLITCYYLYIGTENVFPDEGINIVSVSVHTHVAGRNVKLSHIRAGKEVTRIIDDNFYSHNYQEIRQLENETKVLPGDFMVLECSYNTENLDKPTLGGYSLHEEMCLSIITYYPKTELGRSTIPLNNNKIPSLSTFFCKNYSWLLLNGSC